MKKIGFTKANVTITVVKYGILIWVFSSFRVGENRFRLNECFAAAILFGCNDYKKLAFSLSCGKIAYQNSKNGNPHETPTAAASRPYKHSRLNGAIILRQKSTF